MKVPKMPEWFYTKDFYGANEVVLQTDNSVDAKYKLEIISPFANNFSSANLPTFSLSENMKSLLSEYNISAQVQNNFAGEKLKQFYTPNISVQCIAMVPPLPCTSASLASATCRAPAAPRNCRTPSST